MRILSARIFSKSFGGKIKHGQTDVNKKTTLTMKKYNKIFFFNLTINLWQGFDFTDINTELALAI